MKPGIELDWLIETKVMGHKRLKHPHKDYQDPKYDHCDTKEYECPTCFYDGLWGTMHPKPYSQNMGAAWLVVERMHRHPKPVLMLAAPQQDYAGEKWRCEFSRKWWDEKSPYEYAAEGETAPHAICLAALIWADAWDKDAQA